jgi:hypothetical protein
MIFYRYIATVSTLFSGSSGSSEYGIGYDGLNLYVTGSNSIKIDQVTLAGVRTTLVGGTYGYQDGSFAAAWFTNLGGIDVDADGNIFIASIGDHYIRKVINSGTQQLAISIAGLGGVYGGPGPSGANDGYGSIATFHAPKYLKVDNHGHVYVSDTGEDKRTLINIDRLVI